MSPIFIDPLRPDSGFNQAENARCALECTSQSVPRNGTGFSVAHPRMSIPNRIPAVNNVRFSQPMQLCAILGCRQTGAPRAGAASRSSPKIAASSVANFAFKAALESWVACVFDSRVRFDRAAKFGEPPNRDTDGNSIVEFEVEFSFLNEVCIAGTCIRPLLSGGSQRDIDDRDH